MRITGIINNEDSDMMYQILLDKDDGDIDCDEELHEILKGTVPGKLGIISTRQISRNLWIIKVAKKQS
jgi:hypothetical protein